MPVDGRQSPEIQRYLSTPPPEDELAHRLALQGMFRRCRGLEWCAHIDAHMAEMVHATDDRTRFLIEAEKLL